MLGQRQKGSKRSFPFNHLHYRVRGITVNLNGTYSMCEAARVRRKTSGTAAVERTAATESKCDLRFQGA